MMNILVNLPSDFFSHAGLAEQFERLERLGRVRKTSHNTPAEIREDLGWAEAVLMWSWPVLDAALLDAAPRLKFRGHIDLCRRGAEEALRREVPVVLSRAGFSPAVAEMALALVLNLLRRVSDYHAAMREGRERWVEAFPRDIDVRERELTGRTVVLVGLGAVGRRLAELLQPFAVDLLVVDPFVPEGLIEAAGGRRADLTEALALGEVVILCAASNSGTSHLLGRREIAAMRKDTVLVNVARAALVDMEALMERLRRDEIVAALDVFDREPLPAEDPLRRLPNAYLTPHRAGGVMASVRRNISWLVDDLEAWLQGGTVMRPLTAAMLPGLDG